MNWPVLSFQGGIVDSLVEEFHRTFGFDQVGRLGVPKDSFAVYAGVEKAKCTSSRARNSCSAISPWGRSSALGVRKSRVPVSSRDPGQAVYRGRGATWDLRLDRFRRPAFGDAVLLQSLRPQIRGSSGARRFRPTRSRLADHSLRNGRLRACAWARDDGLGTGDPLRQSLC